MDTDAAPAAFLIVENSLKFRRGKQGGGKKGREYLATRPLAPVHAALGFAVHASLGFALKFG